MVRTRLGPTELKTNPNKKCKVQLMDAKKLAKGASPTNLGGYLKTRAASSHSHFAHKKHNSSSRTTTHNGHKIVLETIYRVTVDGKKYDLGLMADDQGNVHCHSLPNYQLQSALDMVRAIVGQFPDEFEKKRKAVKVAHKHTSPRKISVTKRVSKGK
jgi:hypothetical protein